MNNIVFYNVLGYPTIDKFKVICKLLDKYGVEYLEIGIPSKNPFVDGKTIATIHNDIYDKYDSDILIELLKWIKEHTQLNIILMTYYDGFKTFNIEAIDVDLYNAVLCVDNPLSEFPTIPKINVYDDKDTDEELNRKLQDNVSFCYVKTSDKTGTEINDVSYIPTIKRLRKQTDLPLFLGFGIKNKDDVEDALENGADGVIIGTEFINSINRDVKGLKEVENYLEELSVSV